MSGMIGYPGVNSEYLKFKRIEQKLEKITKLIEKNNARKSKKTKR